MITLRRDNVVKQTESEVVALALEKPRDLSEKGPQKESGSGKRSNCSGKGTEGGTGNDQKPERCAETGTGWCERPA